MTMEMSSHSATTSTSAQQNNVSALIGKSEKGELQVPHTSPPLSEGARMASRGRSGVTFEGEPTNNSEAIINAGDKLLEGFKNPSIGVICVTGYNGMGRWRIVEYATRKLNESHLFDVQILVKLQERDFSLRRVQMGIMNQLGLTASISPDDDEFVDGMEFYLAAVNIYRSLRGRRFLLIIGDVTSRINFESMGIFLGRFPYDSKVVLVGDDKEQRCNLTINMKELSIDILREEATDVAHSSSVEGCFTPEAVFECCLYLWFFFHAIDVEWLTRNWIAEGFIIGGTTEEEEDSKLEEKTRALLRELELRSLVKSNESNNGWELPFWVLDDSQSETLTHDVWSKESGPPKKGEWEGIRWMTFWDITHSELPSSPKCPELSTLQLGLLNNPYSDVEFNIPEPFFKQMQGLRVLHVYNLHIKSLPSSIDCLENFRLLRIQGCKNLKTLPSSFQALHKLEFLEVSESSLESMPDDCFQQMTELRFLLLDGTNIKSLPSSISKLHTLHQLILRRSGSLSEIPDESFEWMQSLRVLDLSDNSNLKSLPSSLSKLVNLRRLVLSNCSSLKTKLLPHLQKLSELEELDFCKCNSLEDIEEICSSVGNILKKLQRLNLSEINTIQRVSLNGYQNLESVSLNGLTSLQVLSLSGTKLQRFPQNISNTDHLRRLDMLGMNHIHEIEWDALSTEIEVLNIDQWGTLNSSANDNEWWARIRVSDHQLLQSLTPSSKSWEAKCFSRFHVSISPYQEEKQRRKRQIIYANFGFKTQTCNLPCTSHFKKHLEIRGGDTSLNGIDGVLSQMELFTLCNNDIIKKLSNLGNVNKMKELKECQIEKCKQLELLFDGDNEEYDTLRSLEKIWMSSLPRLSSVCEGTYGNLSFALLKHIYLEYCPKLVVVFSSSVCLQSLETLQIKFCNRLEAVFQGEAAAQGSLQRLHTVCLWELPKLESICSSICLPALKKLRVSGCGKLNKLPLPGPLDDASTSISGGDVDVDGELVWWTNLKFEEDNIKHHVHFKERRPFTRC